MKTLLETIQEATADEQLAMTIHALVTARFTVTEKDGQTDSGRLPLLVEVKLGKERYAFSVGETRDITLSGPTVDYEQPPGR